MEPPTAPAAAARATARRGKLVVFAADAVKVGPDRIDVSRNPSLSNRLDSSAGDSWDADLFPVDIPAGAGATSVQVFSEPVGQNPGAMGCYRLPLNAAKTPFNCQSLTIALNTLLYPLSEVCQGS